MEQHGQQHGTEASEAAGEQQHGTKAVGGAWLVEEAAAGAAEEAATCDKITLVTETTTGLLQMTLIY